MTRHLILFFVLIIVSTGCGQELTVDMSKAVALDTNTPPVNLAAEVARANAQHKLLLLEFGSSDSCPPCVAFQKYVFSTPQFAAYEKTNLVFVRLDFPLKAALRPDTKATNDLLAVQFDVYAYPTFIALDKDGKDFWQLPKKNDPDPALDTRLFQPKNFIDLLNSVKAKEK